MEDESSKWNDRLTRDLDDWAASFDDNIRREQQNTTNSNLLDDGVTHKCLSDTSSDRDSFEDIELLCVAMAEHALDSNGKTFVPT